jgi:hypothetical protein
LAKKRLIVEVLKGAVTQWTALQRAWLQAKATK